jgi:hypothetical protein
MRFSIVWANEHQEVVPLLMVACGGSKDSLPKERFQDNCND